VYSVSDHPMGRGLHSMWISDFNIFIHGGEGPQGVGPASVRSDTWSFNVYTRVWKQYESSVNTHSSPLFYELYDKGRQFLIFEDVNRMHRQPSVL
jgi:hypothetical protein